ncbi:MAG TPA: hypothetical protein VLH79_08765 [Chthonomonadales bacterium]|nr:hypothetical protein [Chthonomonadales bacterium]
MPWAECGGANPILTWGWAFGADFHDHASRRITANHPRGYHRARVDGELHAEVRSCAHRRFSAGLRRRTAAPFPVGVSLRSLHISSVEDIRRCAPDLQYGMTLIGALPDGETRSSWVGGWCVALPAGSSRSEQGWEPVRWLCADPEATEVVGREKGLMQGSRRSPAVGVLQSAPSFAQLCRI